MVTFVPLFCGRASSGQVLSNSGNALCNGVLFDGDITSYILAGSVPKGDRRGIGLPTFSFKKGKKTLKIHIVKLLIKTNTLNQSPQVKQCQQNDCQNCS